MEQENLAKDKRIKVYIADNSDIESLVTNLKQGFDVVGYATDGETVASELPKSDADVLIMEAMLSKLDGFSVLEKLKAQMGDKLPKVIFISNLSHSGFINKALKSGASYFMVKPIDMNALADRISDVMTIKPEVQMAGAGKQLEEKISNIFITIGIPAHIKGYQFLREAVKLAIEQPEIIGSITKKLYPTIAEKFDTSSSKVERGMRHAIEVAWNRGKIENINQLFGLKIYSSNEKPTNGELIALIADKMLMEM